MFTLKQKTTVAEAIDYLHLIEYYDYSFRHNYEGIRDGKIVNMDELTLRLPYPDNNEPIEKIEEFFNFLANIMRIIQFSEVIPPRLDIAGTRYYILKMRCPVKIESPTYLHKQITKYKDLYAICNWASFDMKIGLKNISKDSFDEKFKNRKKLVFSLLYDDHQATIVTDYGKVAEFYKRYGFRIEPSIYDELQTTLDGMDQ